MSKFRVFWENTLKRKQKCCLCYHCDQFWAQSDAFWAHLPPCTWEWKTMSPNPDFEKITKISFLPLLMHFLGPNAFKYVYSSQKCNLRPQKPIFEWLHMIWIFWIFSWKNGTVPGKWPKLQKQPLQSPWIWFQTKFPTFSYKFN